MTDMEESSLFQVARDLLYLGALKSEVANRYNELHERADEMYRRAGIERQTFKTGQNTAGIDSDTELGLVSRDKDKIVATVGNRDQMMKWLEQNYPDEIITRYDINPAFWLKLKQVSERNGVGVDPETGEVLDWILVATIQGPFRVTSSKSMKRYVEGRAESTMKELTED